MSAKKKATKKGARKRTAKKRATKKGRPQKRSPPRPPTVVEREAEREKPAPVVCNEKELAFIDEWMGPSRFNGTDAMFAAKLIDDSSSRYTAAARASEWLSRPQVLEEITRRREARRQELEHAAERLMTEQMSVALSSIGDVLEWDDERVYLKAKESLTPEQIAAIGQLEVTISEVIRQYAKPAEKGRKEKPEIIHRTETRRVKMHDKLAAIVAMQKQLEPTFQERRRMGKLGEPGGDGITIIVEGGATGLEVTVKKDAA